MRDRHFTMPLLTKGNDENDSSASLHRAGFKHGIRKVQNSLYLRSHGYCERLFNGTRERDSRLVISVLLISSVNIICNNRICLDISKRDTEVSQTTCTSISCGRVYFKQDAFFILSVF